MNRSGVLVASIALLSVFAVPATAFAQETTVGDLPRAISETSQRVEKVTEGSLVSGITTFLINLMTFAADRAAYDAAVLIASGGNGETPLFDKRTVSQYFSDVGKSVAGEAIGLLNEEIDGAGGVLSNFNLCAPRSPYILLSFKFGIKAAFERPEPKCELNEVVENWNGFLADVASRAQGVEGNQLILRELAQVYDPSTNEFSVGLELYSDILGTSWREQSLLSSKFIKSDGFKDVGNFITGEVETPSDMLKEDFYVVKSDQRRLPNLIGQGLLANKDALLQVGIHAGSIFTNTLLSELTQRVYDGFFDFNQVEIDPFNENSFATSNSDDARNRYRSLLSAAPLEVTNYSILSDFSSCPVTARGLYNCVADTSFISAIARAETGAPMTLEEAVEDGLIDSDWPLIPAGDQARNQDPYCYTYGFCHSNLVKLRKARVISVGWELAANSTYNSPDSPVTLAEVMDGFNDCNSAGEPDANHPWCKLIDPTWVLKYPDTQCRAQVFGQLLSSDASDQRMQECVDMPSCIAEDDNGTCTGGYGYCVREENVWRFRGESCPEQFASCITVENDDETVSYLRNTTDPGPCTEDNAGCLWYATEKEDTDGDGTFEWPAVADVAAADAADDTYESRIYFTSAVEECDPEEGGCRELIERTDDLRLNALVNPSFEDDADKNSLPDGWLFTSTSASTWGDAGEFSRSGNGSVKTDSGIIYQPGVVFSQGRFYTVSFYARQETDGTAESAEVLIAFSADDGSTIDLTGTSYSSDCTLGDGDGDGTLDTISVSGKPTGTTYERFSCTFTSPAQSDASAKIVAFVDVMPGGAYVDDLQIEQGEDVSSYHEGYSATDVSTVVVKVPPSYLGCTGGADDPAECAGYAQVCSENDVGCSLYTPTNGDPAVTGVAGDLDYCPSACVGYDTFKQEPTLYEPSGDFPVYFIPDTAEECSEEEVGCDEFTNLETEEKEYFTYLRACVTPEQADRNISSDNEATFYTWEGSDLEGYQLVTWTLLESNLGSSTYTHAVSGESDSQPGSAPCVNWTATDDGITCDDAIDEDGDTVYDWDVESCDEHDDIFSNPDCREFYDANGGIHYREWSKTVTVNEECAAYRKTEIVGETTGIQEMNCEDSGGYFDSANGSCRYYGYEAESITCAESANGCRAYTGGRSRNSRVAFEDLVEDGDLNNWDALSAATLTYSNESLATDGHSILASDIFETFVFNNGTECTDEAGCDGAAVSFGGTCTVVEGETFCGTLDGELYSNKTYTLTFWAKGTGMLNSGFNFLADGGSPEIDKEFGEVELTSGWQEFRVGPLDMNSTDFPDFGDGSTLVFDPSGTAYIDNVVLREGEDSITVIKDSWVTPAVCDESPTGAASPQYYLGCAEYEDQTGDTVYLKSFSKLCDEDKVGCEAFFMTQESDSPHAEVFNAFCSTLDGLPAASATSCYYSASGSAYDTTSPYLCTIAVGQSTCTFDLSWYVDPGTLPSHLSYEPSTEIVPADQDVFLVVNDDVTCSTGTAGCMEVGDVLWSQDKTSTTGAESVFLMNDPDEYEDILCEQNELFCEEWVGSGGTKYYFKNPGDQTCEYRTDVTVGGTAYDGWFKTGTNERCYEDYTVGGDYSGIWKNGDTDYNGWVGTCSVQYDGCSEFQDPLDVPEDEVYGEGDGESYFYLSNENLDENSLPSSQKCNGQVSLKNGCALFNDTGVSAQSYNSSATEMASRHADALFNTAPFDLVDPIDCESGDSTITAADGTEIDLCAQRCVYDMGAINDLSDGLSVNDKLTANAFSGASYSTDEMYAYGTSCYAASDCAPIESESGDMVDASACDTLVDDNVFETSDEGRASVPRLENDTNTVLKVNRDRQCSEWLSCADTQTVWDERTNSYRTICGDIELCTEYSSLGNSSFCSQWKFDDPEVVLNADRYTSRDVTWYGDEYSGFAVPDLFPVQTLSQANVAPPAGYCNLADALANGTADQATYDLHHGDECSSDIDCGYITGTCVTEEEEDYQLVLNAGTCDAQYGESCTVGSCSETGAACASNLDCGSSGGSCIVGSCYELSTSDICASDSDCASDQVCAGGFCATPGAEVDIDGFDSSNPEASCASTETFVEDIALKNGTCMRGQCLLAPDGTQFAKGESEGKVCRAYPEVNSPFSSDLVEAWYDTETQSKLSGTETLDWADTAYDTRSGFENAKFCAPGEVCECTYKKITFGAGDTRYFSEDFDIGDMGVCTSGPKTGAACETDAECADGTELGTCEQPTREDLLLGMDGYCLERDSGININGDRDEQACITWLPVDQLAGSTDLYAKYATAGFFDDATVCATVKPYIDVTISRASGTAANNVACAETTGLGVGGCDTSTTFDSTVLAECANNVVCPDGFYAVMGQCNAKPSALSGYASACVDASGGDDCPYVCVPLGARTDAGTSCDVAGSEDWIDDTETSDSGTTVYIVGDTNYTVGLPEFDAKVDELKACKVKGADFTADTLDSYAQFPNSTGEAEGSCSSGSCPEKSGGDGYRYLYFDVDYAYAACQEALLVSDSSNLTGYAWTDRLWQSSAYVLSDSNANMQFTAETNPAPFGITLESPAERLETERPIVMAACRSGSYVNNPDAGDALNDCTADSGHADVPEEDPASAEGRSFGEFEIYNGYLSSSPDDAWTFSDAYDTVFSRINQLFAAVDLRVDNLFTWVGSWDGTEGGANVGYPSEGSDASAYESYDVRADEGNPPTVWALDTSACSGTECEEGPEDALTINDQNSGEQSALSFFRAYMKFYAAADKNQLPLRRIIVDWGDGTTTGSDDTANFYKNHRGLQDDTTASKCDLNSEWGLTSESCDPNYFSYSHIYTCPSDLLLAGTPTCADANGDGALDESPCVNNPGDPDEVTCSFQPRIHVRDNWGWCGGTCDGADGCYDNDGSLGSLDFDDYCDYTSYPDVLSSKDPWVYYDGVITVDP